MSPVDEAIQLKKSGVSDAFIANHLHQAALRDRRPEPPGVFGNIHLTGEDVLKLKKAGFQDEFITNFEGHPQYVSLALAAIWLKETHDIVAAPILRVFLVPRSFYKKQRPFWRGYMPAGLTDLDKWDLNFGITTRTETDGGGEGAPAEEKMYLLVGLSNQLNPSALFNIGIAMVTKDIRGEQTQPYVGLTVDFNIFKSPRDR
jgi:hypothetical protein